MKNVLVICNYKAGRKTAILNKKKLKKFLFKNAEKFKIIDICSDSELDVTDYDTIIAMGGDGTINQVIPYLINTNKTLGIIPCGTANLLAAKLGIPTDLKKALKIIKEGWIAQLRHYGKKYATGVDGKGTDFISDTF